MRKWITSLFLASTVAGCATRADTTAELGRAPIVKSDGTQAGSALIAEHPNGLILSVQIDGLSGAGPHGIHLHSVGTCQAPAFASAGAHLNPTGRAHGTGNPAGSHLGDLPNLQVDTAGRGRLTTILANERGELRGHLFDADGTAIVVHAEPDDLKTDPSGASGARIACGILTPRSD